MHTRGFDFATCTPEQAAVKLFGIVNTVVRTIVMPIAHNRDITRTGGCFSFWRRDPIGCGVPVVSFPIGIVSPERALRYTFFANEKAARLSSHLGDISSWQSRDESGKNPMDHKYGGAISCPFSNLYFSFSGFSEHEDEMVCVFVANFFGLADNTFTRAVIVASQNQTLFTYSRNLFPTEFTL